MTELDSVATLKASSPRSETVKHNVYRSVLQLICEGKQPTVRKVIATLGRGSHSTIGPLLADLKQRTNNYDNLGPLNEYLKLSNGHHQARVDLGANELIQSLSKTIEYLEQENMSLKQSLLQNERLKMERNHYKALFENLREEREAFSKATANAKRQEIEFMAAEYKAINIENAKANLDFGSRLDDRLIEKEVQIINLKEKLQKAEAKQSHNLEQDPNYMKLKKTVRLLKQENERLVNQKHADNSQERSC